MSKYLIVYGTKEGHTAKIAQRISDVIRQHGHTIDIYDARKLPASLSLDGYNGILVGLSIHMFQWSSAARNFVRNNKHQLEITQSAFFSVSLTAANKDLNARSQLDYWIEKFFDATGWHPKVIGNFAGCLAYTRYGFFTRFVMKSIARSQNESTDTSKDHEFTNWEEVIKFAEDFVQQTQQDAH
jgi:menaquinone-dependent protoporphyrinogen oxidase